VSEFVDECRREWRRLGVPDPVANEMAADLIADLEEAEAEGATPEDVLGNSAFDPRRFAAAWATARGVTGPPTAGRLWPTRRPVVTVLSVLAGVLTIAAAFGLLVVRGSTSVAFAARHIVAGPGPLRLFPPGHRIVLPLPGGGPFGVTRIEGIDVHPLALLLLIIGVASLAVFAVLYWRPWFGPTRHRGYDSQRSRR
jgi:hypothetical protein